MVRREELGPKRLIHNYGHGGAGITLSWGTAHEAVGISEIDARESCVVIGCGVVGLATARLLQRRGAKVTIIARDLPPHTTSNIAGGHWWPVSVFRGDRVDARFLDRFHAAVRTSYREFQALVGPRYGVSWRRNFSVSAERVEISPFTESLRDVAPGLRILEPGDHPFGRHWVQTYDTMMIEPSVYLRALLDDFLTAGGRVDVGELKALSDIQGLSQGAIFNCTGLGARDLVGDADLVPARGQLVVLRPQDDVDYNLFFRNSYAFPRTDGLILGGTFQRGDWNLQPDPVDTAQILEAAATGFGKVTASR